MAWTIKSSIASSVASRMEILPGITTNDWVKVITTNGFQIKCKIVRANVASNTCGGVPFITIKDEDGNHKHIFIHAISTIEEI